MKNKVKFMLLVFILIIISTTFFIYIKDNFFSNRKKIITIGYQIPTAQTWGSLIIKNQKILEKELDNKEIKVQWFNASSGTPLINGMISNQIDVMYLGDMPTLIAGEKMNINDNYKPKLLNIDGRGVNGNNQAIIARKDINKENIQNETIITSYGSSSHILLLKYLKENDLSEKVNIEFKDLAVGVEELKKNQIAAISVWEPFKTIGLENNNKVLYDGKNTKEDYLSGIVINTSTINKKEVESMNNAIINSHKFIKNHPKKTVEIISEETGYSKSIVKKAIKNIEFNQKISSKDINTFQNNQKTLIDMKEMNKYDFTDFLYYQ